MKTIELFRLYLLHNTKSSDVTIKNYVSDVNKFIKWYEIKLSQTFSPENLTSEIVTLFINEHDLLIKTSDTAISPTNQSNSTSIISARSFDRYLSSLRRFAAYLVEAKYLDVNPFEQISK